MIDDLFGDTVREAMQRAPDVALDRVRREALRVLDGYHRVGYRCGERCPHRRGVAFCAAFNERLGPGDPPIACATCRWLVEPGELLDELNAALSRGKS
jgi:hypothetical protein